MFTIKYFETVLTPCKKAANESYDFLLSHWIIHCENKRSWTCLLPCPINKPKILQVWEIKQDKHLS